MTASAFWSSLAISADTTVDYGKDVLPILRQHCLDCHGPDTAEAGFRLDSELHALRGGDSGEPAIVPGKPDQSYVLIRILHEDESQRMPPDSDPLPEADIEVLRKWIQQNESWRPVAEELADSKIDHWSFQPFPRPEVPAGASHPIDAFIDAKLQALELTRSHAANRRKLVRRAYLLLLGMPPTPEQVNRFLNDSTDKAWGALVDELLASPHFGERMATQWLDLIRFGETHGFETNRERPNAWHYRDWVIDAFNSDMPYDEFIMKQMAGDALGDDVATGFLVAGPYDLVKGQDPQLRLMQRQDELAGMINTTGTAFLGLTIGCAQCHNHKFDPVTQTDYYSMQAVFAGVNHADRALPLPAETKQRIAELDQKIAGLEQQLVRFVRQPKPANPDGKPQRAAVNALLNTDQVQPVDAKFVRFTIEETNGGQPCIDELEIFSNGRNLALASAGAKATSSGDFVHPLHKLEHINDGQYGNPRSWISSVVAGGWVQIELADAAKVERIVWARDREGRYGDRLATKYRIESSLDGTNWTVIASSADRKPYAGAQTKPPEIEYNFDAFPESEAQRGRALFAKRDQLKQQRDALATPVQVYAGTFNQPGPTHRLYRGEPSAPREQVVPAAIASLSNVKLDANSPEQQRRLEIAKWIASPDNPLTARVIVNRIWQFHFGTGIVDTPSDFGANGTTPTHPELLDWLASELVKHNWSLKHIHRLILTSQTWQQDSQPHSSGMLKDASSRYLWRFPMRRLSAEGIRDSILTVTGKIDLRAGGPGFSPFEVEAENVRHYHPKKEFGPEDWRRMIYMTRVRQEREAVFGVFDCPDFSQVVPQRSRSTTPLQALNLLNSHFVNEQAEFLSERLDREATTPDEKIQRAYQLCFARPASDDEVRAAKVFVEETDWNQFARVLLNSNEFVFIP